MPDWKATTENVPGDSIRGHGEKLAALIDALLPHVPRQSSVAFPTALVLTRSRSLIHTPTECIFPRR